MLVRNIFKKHYDPNTDAFYYVNYKTGETKWTKPALLGDEELDLEFPPAAPTRCNCMGRQFDASVWWVWEPEGPEGKRPDHAGFNIEIWRKEGNLFNHKSSKWVSAVEEDLGEAEAAAKKLGGSPTSSPNEKKKNPSPEKVAGADGRIGPMPVPSSTIIPNLIEGRSYKFRVTASNKWGESTPSPFSEEVVLEPPCPEGYEHHRIPAERAPDGKAVEWWVCLRTDEKLWERPKSHDKYAITPHLARLFTKEDILGFLGPSSRCRCRPQWHYAWGILQQ